LARTAPAEVAEGGGLIGVDGDFAGVIRWLESVGEGGERVVVGLSGIEFRDEGRGGSEVAERERHGDMIRPTSVPCGVQDSQRPPRRVAHRVSLAYFSAGSELDFIQFQTAATSVRQVLAAVQGFFSC